MAQRSFKLPDALDAELVAKAAKLDRPVSWVIVRCLEVGLHDGNDAKQQMDIGAAVMRGALASRGA